MSTLAHQHIVHRLNSRAEVERDNARMAELERRATPLFYTIFGIAAAVVLWMLTAGYRDVIQHRLDTMADRQQYERISATLASCANSGVAPFDGAVLRCERVELVSLK